MKKQGIAIILLLLSPFYLEAQTTPTADDLFQNARKAAFEEKNYQKAKELAYQALGIAPSYADIDIFLGRMYTWSDEYDSARSHFSKVLDANPSNEDAITAYADLEYWQHHYKDALAVCNSGLVFYPASEALLIRKAKNLDALKNYREANLITGQLLQKNKYNTEALKLATKLKDANAVNKITVDYGHTSFDKQFDKPWQLASISYCRQTNIGAVISRVNYANRFGANGIQGEVDAFPHISRTFYSYINAGYSGNAGIFPNFRAGLSLYANLPNSFETEVGLRYLYFTGSTYIFTASLGKYYKNFFFNARTYITPSRGSASQSYTLSGRYYLEGADDYISLNVGTGISPDDNSQNILLNSKQTQLTSRKISVNFNHTFLKWNVISISAGLIHQEYLPSVKGNQFDASIALSHRF